MVMMMRLINRKMRKTKTRLINTKRMNMKRMTRLRLIRGTKWSLPIPRTPLPHSHFALSNQLPLFAASACHTPDLFWPSQATLNNHSSYSGLYTIPE